DLPADIAEADKPYRIPLEGSSAANYANENTARIVFPAVGSYTLWGQYRKPDASQPIDKTSTTITVTLPVTPVIIYPDMLCTTDAAILLTATIESVPYTGTGFTFTGAGITTSGSSWYFDPATAGAGVHTLHYTFSDTGYCDMEGTLTITVTLAPKLGPTYRLPNNY
ncbi:MAG: hypothetical protein LBV39_04720, partial [Bacteroidales bacterium]|nr:hypothetical protein [Bacteroidales bacterium]